MTPLCLAQQGMNDSPQKLLPMQWLHHSPGGFCQPQRLSGPGACLGHWTCGDTLSELLPGSTGKGMGVVCRSWPGPHTSEPHLLRGGSRVDPRTDTAKAQWAQHFTVYIDLLYFLVFVHLVQGSPGRHKGSSWILSQGQCGFPDISGFSWVKTVMSSTFQNMRSQDLLMRQGHIM